MHAYLSSFCCFKFRKPFDKYSKCMGQFICFVLTVTKPCRRTDFLASKKAATVDQDHKFRCKFLDCSKSFRKAKLLHYHMKYFHGVEKAAESQQNPVKRNIQTRASLASEKANQERSKRGRTTAGSLCKYGVDLFLFFKQQQAGQAENTRNQFSFGLKESLLGLYLSMFLCGEEA